MWKAMLRLLGLNDDAPKVGVDADAANEVRVAVTSRENDERPIQLVIGLDFGTSFTKVVVGESRARYAVPFDQHVRGSVPFLLPSSLCVLAESRECVLGTKVQDGECFDNLKMPLIERDFSEEHQVRAAAFLALVLRHTREWLLDTKSSTYGHRKINWYINVGLPTDSYDDEDLISTYRGIVGAAWFVSASKNSVSLAEVSRTLACDKSNLKAAPDLDTPALPEDRINTFPEFSAQVSGYVSSPRREEGLHAMVDVGGGTFDVTVFYIFEWNGELRFPIFARTVRRLGTRYLMRSRLEELNGSVDDHYSPFDHLPSDGKFCERYGVGEARLRKVDKAFGKKVEDAVCEQILDTKINRVPKDPHWFKDTPPSPKYGKGIPSFFCGGGALSEFYSSLLRAFEQAENPYKLKSLELPVPESLRSLEIAPDVYPRLTVAHGLSLDPGDIGRVIRMNEVPDEKLEADGASKKGHFVGKDDV